LLRIDLPLSDSDVVELHVLARSTGCRDIGCGTELDVNVVASH